MATTTKRKPVPYWLAGGTETCEACGHLYVLEQERRCAACDAGLCEHCAETDERTREVLCAGCRDGGGGDGG
jgi:hypothetical protein